MVQDLRPKTDFDESAFLRLDCLGIEARVVARVKGQDRSYLIDHPQNLKIYTIKEASIEMACGPQKEQPIVVESVPGVNAKLGTVGIVRGLEFR